jgi:hypothetical protein
MQWEDSVFNRRECVNFHWRSKCHDSFCFAYCVQHFGTSAPKASFPMLNEVKALFPFKFCLLLTVSERDKMKLESHIFNHRMSDFEISAPLPRSPSIIISVPCILCCCYCYPRHYFEYKFHVKHSASNIIIE